MVHIQHFDTHCAVLLSFARCAARVFSRERPEERYLYCGGSVSIAIATAETVVTCLMVTGHPPRGHPCRCMYFGTAVQNNVCMPGHNPMIHNAEKRV
jgi:hypothetical protein